MARGPDEYKQTFKFKINMKLYQYRYYKMYTERNARYALNIQRIFISNYGNL